MLHTLSRLLWVRLFCFWIRFAICPVLWYCCAFFCWSLLLLLLFMYHIHWAYMHFPFKFINSVEFNAKFQATQYLSRQRSEPYSFVRIHIYLYFFVTLLALHGEQAPVRYREILNAKYAASLLKALSGILIEQQTKNKTHRTKNIRDFFFFWFWVYFMNVELCTRLRKQYTNYIFCARTHCSFMCKLYSYKLKLWLYFEFVVVVVVDSLSLSLCLSTSLSVVLRWYCCCFHLNHNWKS